MKLSKLMLVLAAGMCLCREAHSDFYFRQEVHAEQQGLEGAAGEGGVLDFRREVFVVDQVFSIQVEEKGRLKKEYGFDFAKNLYYEADPSAGYYKMFDLGVLGAAFEKMGQEIRARRPARGQVAAELTRAMLEGKLDYPVRVQPAFFGKKSFSGHEAGRYKLRAGPGSAFLNFFGWYRKADIWASSQVPGFAEYAPLRARLARKASFYKIKHNRISDFITTISVLEPLPLQVDSVARRRFERAGAVETTHEVTTAVSTAKIKKDRLLYFKQSARFSWNAVYSKGTEFGPEVSLERGENFSWRRSLPWLIAPVFFIFFTALWFLGPFPDKDRFSLGRMLVLRLYILSALLFAMQAVHYLSDIPYLVSPWAELSMVAATGAILIFWRAVMYQSGVEKQMREAGLKVCPHCRARCESFYIVCPKCNRAIMPAEHAHGSQLPPE